MFGLLWGLEYFNHGAQDSMGACAVKMWERFGPALVVLLSLLPAIVYDSIRISNRFIGPLIRLRTAMQEVAQDETMEPLRCRRNDFAEDFFIAFNEMLERVNQLEEDRRKAREVARTGDTVAAGQHTFE
jgi:nitrogen fixation/metabolism regulation signal transduction histidine kinase